MEYFKWLGSPQVLGCISARQLLMHTLNSLNFPLALLKMEKEE